MLTRCYKYRIYPDKDQQDHLDQTVFRATRFIWNWIDKPGTIFKAPLLDYPTALAPV